MRVVFPIIGGSGVEIFHHRLKTGLSQMGVESEIVKFRPQWEYLPWALPWALSQSDVWAYSWDLIHVNADYGCFFKRKGHPLIATLHHLSVDHEYLQPLPGHIRLHHQLILKPIVRETLEIADRLVAVSQFTKASYCEVFQKDFNIRVIYNGIDSQRFHPQNSDNDLATRPIRLFFSGNPTRRKGIDLLASVMRRLGNDFLLNYTTGLRSIPPPLNGTNIHCLGFLSEAQLIKALNQSDIAFQPSRREGFGQSILEAMACGKPVVSTNCSAIPEVVEHGKGGVLCEPESVDQMVNAIQTLAQSTELRKRMGAYNRQVVLEKFTLQQMASQYHSVYETLVA